MKNKRRLRIILNSGVIATIFIAVFIILLISLFNLKRRSDELNTLNKKMTQVSTILNRFMSFERETKKYIYLGQSSEQIHKIREINIDTTYLKLKQYRLESEEMQLLDVSYTLFTRIKKKVMKGIVSGNTIDPVVIDDIEVLVDSFQDYFAIVNTIRSRHDGEISRSFIYSMVSIVIAILLSFILTVIFSVINERFQKSRESFHSIVDISSDGIIIVDRNNQIRFRNSAAELALDNQIDEILAKLSESPFNKLSRQEIRITRTNKKEGIGELTVEMTSWEGEEAYLLNVRDITRRKEEEEKLRKSFEKIKVLVHELHHRIKNNLQLVLSLIKMPIRYHKNEMLSELLNDTRNRIYSIALVHEMFYRSDSYAFIKFSDYVNEIVTKLCHAFARIDQKIETDIQIDEIILNIDLAIPCGIIINECISNSLKHAFKDTEVGLISISFTQPDKGHFQLTIADNGSGLPEDSIFGKKKTLGMTLIRIITENQLNGTVETLSENGTSFIIEFPDE